MIKMSDNNNTVLRAVYNASTSSHKFEHLVAAPVANDAPSKQIYFTDLRASAKQLQNEINVFLTSKMEEDKLQSNQEANKQAAIKSKDEDEEENYGEERPEED